MNRKLQRVIVLSIYGICSAGVAVFSGCQRGMALDAGPKAMNLDKESIGIFTLRTVNQLKPSYQPEVTLVSVISSGSKKKDSAFTVGRPSSQRKNEFIEYIISVQLAPGAYRLDGSVEMAPGVSKLSGVHGKSVSWPLVQGAFAFPIEAGFYLPPKSVVYLGHVEMVNRKAKEGDRRSGGMLPLIDQAATGFYEGTFDVTVSDRSETDLPLITRTYPFLEKHTIPKAIMTR